MSDYCKGCRFDPKTTCPVTPMYWAFLERHESLLRDNPRMQVPLAALRRRSDHRRRADAATFERVSTALARGQVLELDVAAR